MTWFKLDSTLVNLDMCNFIFIEKKEEKYLLKLIFDEHSVGTEFDSREAAEQAFDKMQKNVFKRRSIWG